MHHRFLFLPVLLASLMLAGCSTRASAESECRRQPPGAYEDCMRRVNRQTCEDYEKERTRKQAAPDASDLLDPAQAWVPRLTHAVHMRMRKLPP